MLSNYNIVYETLELFYFMSKSRFSVLSQNTVDVPVFGHGLWKKMIGFNCDKSSFDESKKDLSQSCPLWKMQSHQIKSLHWFSLNDISSFSLVKTTACFVKNNQLIPLFCWKTWTLAKCLFYGRTFYFEMLILTDYTELCWIKMWDGR